MRLAGAASGALPTRTPPAPVGAIPIPLEAPKLFAIMNPNPVCTKPNANTAFAFGGGAQGPRRASRGRPRNPESEGDGRHESRRTAERFLRTNPDEFAPAQMCIGMEALRGATGGEIHGVRIDAFSRCDPRCSGCAPVLQEQAARRPLSRACRSRSGTCGCTDGTEHHPQPVAPRSPPEPAGVPGTPTPGPELPQAHRPPAEGSPPDRVVADRGPGPGPGERPGGRSGDDTIPSPPAGVHRGPGHETGPSRWHSWCRAVGPPPGSRGDTGSPLRWRSGSRPPLESVGVSGPDSGPSRWHHSCTAQGAGFQIRAHAMGRDPKAPGGPPTGVRRPGLEDPPGGLLARGPQGELELQSAPGARRQPPQACLVATGGPGRLEGPSAPTTGTPEAVRRFWGLQRPRIGHSPRYARSPFKKPSLWKTILREGSPDQARGVRGTPQDDGRQGATHSTFVGLRGAKNAAVIHSLFAHTICDLSIWVLCII